MSVSQVEQNHARLCTPGNIPSDLLQRESADPISIPALLTQWGKGPGHGRHGAKGSGHVPTGAWLNARRTGQAGREDERRQGGGKEDSGRHGLKHRNGPEDIPSTHSGYLELPPPTSVREAPPTPKDGSVG